MASARTKNIFQTARLDRFLSALCALFFACFGFETAPAAAADIRIQPLSLSVDSQASGSFDLENTDSTTYLRLQIKPYAWQESSHNIVDLRPTREVVAFPPLLTISPLDHRSVRVGVVASQGDVERSYRISIIELPPVGSSDRRIRSRFTVPVFLPPVHAMLGYAVDDAVISGDHLRLAVRNTGNAHFTVRDIQAVLLARDGTVLDHASVGGWYVLAQSTVIYTIPHHEGVCEKTDRAEISVNIPGMNTQKAIIPVSRSCSRS